MKKRTKKTRHMWLSVGCGEGHADFRVEDGKHICNVCDVDFTEEAKEILIALQQSLLNISN